MIMMRLRRGTGDEDGANGRPMVVMIVVLCARIYVKCNGMDEYHGIVILSRATL